jgi:hypothetical protein
MRDTYLHSEMGDNTEDKVAKVLIKCYHERDGRHILMLTGSSRLGVSRLE